MIVTSISLALTVVLLSSLAEAKTSCGFECPEVIWGESLTTIKEMVLKNLKQAGPSDGICSKGDKWIIDGSFYKMPSKCVCLSIPKGKNIKRGKGKRCPDTLLGKPSETFAQLDRRIYRTFKKFAPQDGWCPKGSVKWIISGKSIGKKKDICKCVHNYKFYEPDGQCSSHSSSSSS